MTGDRAAKSKLTFQSGLERIFRGMEGINPFLPLALADVGGLAAPADQWLRRHAVDGVLRLGPHGDRSVADLLSVWTTLKNGSPEAALAAVRSFLLDPQDAFWIVSDLIAPLALVGRVDTVPTMFERLLDEGADEPFAINNIAIGLGRAGAWQEALDLCAVWRSHGHWAFANASSYENLFWKHIYHQGQTERVLPPLLRLASDQTGLSGEYRQWTALAYRIRAGRTDLDVPVIPRGRQPNGYYHAAAMQIAALEHDASARRYVADLRHAISGSRSMTIGFAGRGITARLDMEPEDCHPQRIMIAARRKDYAAVSALVEATPYTEHEHPADKAIEAFLEEGDWRRAAGIAEAYDLRKRAVPRGFSDTRKQDYLALQTALTCCAARAGEAGAAALFHESYKLAAMLMPDPQNDDDVDEEDSKEGVTTNRSDAKPKGAGEPVGLWTATLIAGIAEGRLPPHAISMFLPPFTRPPL